MAGVLLCRSARQALKGAAWLGSYSVDWHIRHLKGAPWVGSYSVVWCIRHLMASPSIVQLLVLACGEREAMVMALPPTRDWAVSPCFHGCLAFFHRHFPPQFPPSHPSILLSAVNSSPHPGIAPQSLNSSSQLLLLIEDLRPCPGYAWLQQGLSDSHSI